MAAQFTPVVTGTQLSDQVAQQMAAEIRTGRIVAGERLPTEARLAEQFRVSRTVVREAVSRLKSLGLVDSRQGSGVFVTAKARYTPLDFDPAHTESREAVIQIAEVRRALEAEAASLAAQRRTKDDVTRIRQAVQALDKAVRNGGDGIEEDVLFHQAIADASHNPFLIDTLKYLSQFMRQAIAVTRANEARRADFTVQVHHEHAALLEAIAAGDAPRARLSAARHMRNASRRIASADPAFWRQQGERLAQPLRPTCSSS